MQRGIHRRVTLVAAVFLSAAQLPPAISSVSTLRAARFEIARDCNDTPQLFRVTPPAGETMRRSQRSCPVVEFAAPKNRRRSGNVQQLEFVECKKGHDAFHALAGNGGFLSFMPIAEFQNLRLAFHSRPGEDGVRAICNGMYLNRQPVILTVVGALLKVVTTYSGEE